jgi:hypothetical protein
VAGPPKKSCWDTECENDCCSYLVVVGQGTPCYPSGTCDHWITQSDDVYFEVAADFGYSWGQIIGNIVYCKYHAGICPEPCGYAIPLTVRECGSKMVDPSNPVPSCNW